MNPALFAALVVVVASALVLPSPAFAVPDGSGTMAVADPSPATLAAASDPSPTPSGGTYGAGFLHGLGEPLTVFGTVSTATSAIFVVTAAVQGFPEGSGSALALVSGISLAQLGTGLLLTRAFGTKGGSSYAWRAGRGHGAGIGYLGYAGAVAALLLTPEPNADDDDDESGMAVISGVLVAALAAGAGTYWMVDGSVELGRLLADHARDEAATAYRPRTAPKVIVPILSGAW